MDPLHFILAKVHLSIQRFLSSFVLLFISSSNVHHHGCYAQRERGFSCRTCFLLILLFQNILETDVMS